MKDLGKENRNLSLFFLFVLLRSISHFKIKTLQNLHLAFHSATIQHSIYCCELVVEYIEQESEGLKNK